jgi:hypothetical protein
MPFTGKVTSLPFTHASQPDKPTFPSSSAFKAALDSTPQALQEEANGIIDQLNETAAGNSGSENVGSASISGVTGNTVYAQLSDINTKAVTASQASGTSTTPITGVTGSNVQTMLESLQNNITSNIVTTAKIADSAVTNAKVADNAVTTTKLVDSNVTTSKISDNAITTAKIVDSNVTTNKIVDNAITTAKIVDGNITTAKIANDSVVTAKITDGNVTNAKIASGTITSDKLVTGTLDNRYYTESEIDTTLENYYTKTNLQTSGQSFVHWNNLTNVPAMADSSWKPPVATVSALPTTGNTNGDLRIVLDVDTVYTWDAPTASWKVIGATGNGITSHSTLNNLTNDDHPQYLRTDGTRTFTGNQNFNKYQALNLVTHNSAIAPTSPVEGQLWYDTTLQQMKVYKGAVKGWVDVSGQGALIRDKEFTATAGQTVFSVANVGTYVPSTNAISVFVNGSLLRENQYTETSTTVVTLNIGATAGQIVYIKWFENDPALLADFAKKDGTLQSNLNADLLDGQHASAFVQKTGDTMTGELRTPIVRSTEQILTDDIGGNWAGQKTKMLWASFPDGVADQAVDVRFGNEPMMGFVEIEITGAYFNANATGSIVKRINTGADSNWIYSSQSEVKVAMAPMTDHFSIGELYWSSANASFYIPISHLNSAGNSILIKVTYSSPANMPPKPITLSPMYTLTPLAKNVVNFTGQVLTSAGTVTAPAIAPSGDSNTGIFFPSADTVAIGEGGTEVMRINSSGNVGIGTTNPTQKLEVSGNVSLYSDNHGQNTGSEAVYNKMIFHNNGYNVAEIRAIKPAGAWGDLGILAFNTGNYIGNNEAMRINSNGNVGIGTTSPNFKLHVNNPSNVWELMELSNMHPGAGAHIRFRHPLSPANGYDIGAFGGADAFTFRRNSQEQMRIDSAGNVGIGTTNPTSKLTVVGSAHVVSDGFGPAFFGVDGTISGNTITGAYAEITNIAVPASLEVWGTATVQTPTASNHAATKGYVDSAGIGSVISLFPFGVSATSISSGNTNITGSGLISSSFVDYPLLFETALAGGKSVYFEATMLGSGGSTVYAALKSSTGTLYGQISRLGSSFARVRSSAITIPNGTTVFPSLWSSNGSTVSAHTFRLIII